MNQTERGWFSLVLHKICSGNITEAPGSAAACVPQRLSEDQDFQGDKSKMVPRASWDIIWWDCVWAQSTYALTYLYLLVMRKNPAPRLDKEGQMMPSAGERDLYFSTASLARVWRDGLKAWWLSGEGQWHNHMGSRGEGKGVNLCWIPRLGGHSGQIQRLIWEFSWNPPKPGLLFAIFPKMFRNKSIAVELIILQF